ncbi:MAG: DUF1653 domain-containing protein [Clostridia bacterium]|nr:DUF1653 domain-containing protein [Clostridia bacterium]
MEEIQKGVYQHYKGNKYEVVDVVTHSETLEKMVLYKAMYDTGELWVRPLSMWNELVEVNGEKVLRFSYLHPVAERSCGAAIYREREGRIEYLVLLQCGSKSWSFPKGHMEAGESRRQTALREVKEETGMSVKLFRQPCKTVTYTLRNNRIKYVHLFLAKARGPVRIKRDEIRAYRWVDKEEAIRLLPKVGFRKVLDTFETYIAEANESKHIANGDY